MRIHEVVCTNQNGDTLTISKSSNFKLVEDIETSGLSAVTNYATNHRMHGAIPISSKLEQRDFSLLFYMLVESKQSDWIQRQRNRVFKVFNPIYNPVRIEFKTEISVYIEANVETTPYFEKGIENNNSTWQKCLVQLSAGNPFYQNTVKVKTDIATWTPMFEFELEFGAGGIELGERVPSLIVNVYNDGQTPTGMIIQFRAVGTLLNPSILNVNTREYFKLNKDMVAGEVITINTNQGQKRVESLLNNVTTNIFNYMDFNSAFMQLDVGDNLFQSNAEERVENLEVTIYHTAQFLGV
ncbi:phage distal tail protein [Chengkuizengella sp. SCS-71B]|uniref:phage distal tail protein n=1 Tax=Chengkuizengella sp. SCS-71B TaxID=3115290 RepID=UPI0032C226B8